MMRACIGVYSPTDLWFNQGIEEQEEEERRQRQFEGEQSEKSDKPEKQRRSDI